MSMMSAPSSRIAQARASAMAGAVHSPASENESGVTLSTPITRTRSSDKRCRPHASTADRAISAYDARRACAVAKLPAGAPIRQQKPLDELPDAIGMPGFDLERHVKRRQRELTEAAVSTLQDVQ